jgi:hypothetical protein
LLSANVQTQQTLNSVAGLSLEASTNGGLASNYHSLSTLNSSVDLTPRTLTVDAVVADKTFDGSTTATVTRLSSAHIIAGEDLSLSHASADFSDSSASTDPKTVTVNGIALSGSAAGNYQLANTQTVAMAKILPIQPTSSLPTEEAIKPLEPNRPTDGSVRPTEENAKPLEPSRPQPVYPWQDGVAQWRPPVTPSSLPTLSATASGIQMPERVPFTTQDAQPSATMCLSEAANDCMCEHAGVLDSVSVCFTPPEPQLSQK